MKKFLYILTALTLIAVVFVFIPTGERSPEESLTSNNASLQRFPWHIEKLENGAIKVFNITPGETTFGGVDNILQGEQEIGIIVRQDNQARLEKYYSKFKAGPIAGKLIITADASEALLEEIVGQTEAGKYIKSGARKFIPNSQDLGTANTLPIKQVIFLPAINLDEGIIEKRFGTANQVINVHENLNYYIFADKGLIIALYEESKEVLHYMHPKKVEQFVEGIKEEKAQYDAALEKETAS